MFDMHLNGEPDLLVHTKGISVFPPPEFVSEAERLLVLADETMFSKALNCLFEIKICIYEITI